MEIKFRQIKIEDSSIIRNWIKTNEFAKRWYFYNKTPRLLTLKNKIANKLKEKDLKAYLVCIDNVPIGYIQSYPVCDKSAWGKKVKVHDNTVSLDYYIGDINYIHKRLGSLIINEYIEQVIKKDGFEYVMISPDPENKVQLRLMEKCKFEYIKTVNVPYSNSKNREAIYIKNIK